MPVSNEIDMDNFTLYNEQFNLAEQNNDSTNSAKFFLSKQIEKLREILKKYTESNNQNEKNKTIRNKYRKTTFYKLNMAFYITILLYIFIQIILVLLQLLVIHPNINNYLRIARASGILITFNSCLTILLVLRGTVTLIRNSIIGQYYSVLEDFLKFHKKIGFWLMILAVIHTTGHAFNLCLIYLFMLGCFNYFLLISC